MTTFGARSRRLGTLLALATGASALTFVSTSTAALSAGVTTAVAAMPAGDDVTTADVDTIGAALGTTSTDAGWEAVSSYDADDDLAITVADLVAAAQQVLFDDGSFALLEASAMDMQAAMNAGVVTSVELTQAYLDRIAAYDTTVLPAETGRALNSIIATSDVALEAAAASDAARAENGGPQSLLDGIPVLLKDNYNTEDLPTTAGCGCWGDNQTEEDAFMVAGLRDAGAVILGKTSLDEFAFGFVSEFSALSEPGSSRLVASPYRTASTAGGSSGGTGAAIAANLGAIGFGTDTGGSIRVPSSYNQLVGIRPTVGVASRAGIVPLALSQDTGGPMARSVSDAAIALDAVVGTDAADPATADADANLPETYTDYLDPNALEGATFAYVDSMVPGTNNASNAAARRLFLEAVADLEAQGADVVQVTAADLGSIDGIGLSQVLSEGSGSTNEFAHDLNEYVADYLDPDVEARDLIEISTSGHTVPSRVGTYASRGAVTQTTYETWMASHMNVLTKGKQLVTEYLDENGYDAMIYPSGTPYGTFSTNLRLGPNTGMPSITVPMGQTTEADAVTVGAGAGVNLEMLGRDFAEGDLIGLAYSYEQATEHRTSPALYPGLAGDVFAGPGEDTDEPGDGAVTVEASAARVKAGDTFTVTVSQSAADLYGYDLDLGFDADAVELVDVSGEDGSTYVTEGDGTVSIAHTELGTSPPSQGDTELATLTFEALAASPTDVEVTGLTTVDAEGATTPVEDVAPATVTVVKAASTVTATVTPKVVKSGRRVTVAVTVTGPVDPTGTVKVLVGKRLAATKTLSSAGKATVRVVVKGRGARPVTVRYGGSAALKPASKVLTVRATR